MADQSEITPETRTYVATFIGRKRGAIGIFDRISVLVDGTSPADAEQRLYERFEHISGLTFTLHTPARETPPARCRKQAIEVHPNGYRTCAEHAEPGGAPCMDETAGPCDYPMDGLGAAPLQRPETIRANTCPYCGAPYRLATGGCERHCPGSRRHAQLVRDAADADVTEQDEQTDPVLARQLREDRARANGVKGSGGFVGTRDEPRHG